MLYYILYTIYCKVVFLYLYILYTQNAHQPRSGTSPRSFQKFSQANGLLTRWGSTNGHDLQQTNRSLDVLFVAGEFVKCSRAAHMQNIGV